MCFLPLSLLSKFGSFRSPPEIIPGHARSVQLFGLKHGVVYSFQLQALFTQSGGRLSKPFKVKALEESKLFGSAHHRQHQETACFWFLFHCFWWVWEGIVRCVQ